MLELVSHVFIFLFTDGMIQKKEKIDDACDSRVNRRLLSVPLYHIGVDYSTR